mmetsp:Transcript_80461/g.232464  ORF Transcript_80461/g.232464 Transcript_80461/m.232464 type:complete len:485 (+) Transcript_80461:226-1680(+)
MSSLQRRMLLPQRQWPMETAKSVADRISMCTPGTLRGRSAPAAPGLGPVLLAAHRGASASAAWPAIAARRTTVVLPDASKPPVPRAFHDTPPAASAPAAEAEHTQSITLNKRTPSASSRRIRGKSVTTKTLFRLQGRVLRTTLPHIVTASSVTRMPLLASSPGQDEPNSWIPRGWGTTRKHLGGESWNLVACRRALLGNEDGDNAEPEESNESPAPLEIPGTGLGGRRPGNTPAALEDLVVPPSASTKSPRMLSLLLHIPLTTTAQALLCVEWRDLIAEHAWGPPAQSPSPSSLMSGPRLPPRLPLRLPPAMLPSVLPLPRRLRGRTCPSICSPSSLHQTGKPISDSLRRSVSRDLRLRHEGVRKLCPISGVHSPDEHMSKLSPERSKLLLSEPFGDVEEGLAAMASAATACLNSSGYRLLRLTLGGGRRRLISAKAAGEPPKNACRSSCARPSGPIPGRAIGDSDSNPWMSDPAPSSKSAGMK